VVKPATLVLTAAADETGIKFSNDLTYTEDFNPYTYRNFFNGGGVAIGDINNDGLPDIFFCSNQHSNKLFLNKGGFVFEDITEAAGVGSKDVWSTGVTLADVNGDGWLDIYVCKSGNVNSNNRSNELFINEGKAAKPKMASRRYTLRKMARNTDWTIKDYLPMRCSLIMTGMVTSIATSLAIHFVRSAITTS
jgi:hypothetical protein